MAGMESRKEKNMVYKWRTYDYPVPAQEAGEHIEELDKKYGEVTPEILLEDARPEGSLLHPLYEWCDDVAAEKYRLQQSGKILRELVVVKVDHPEFEPDVPVRAFIPVTPRQSKGIFRPIVDAMSDEETRRQVFENALQELAMFEAKYKHLVDFAELINTYMASRK